MEYKKDSVEEILEQLRTDRVGAESAPDEGDVESILESLGFEKQKKPAARTERRQPKTQRQPEEKPQPKEQQTPAPQPEPAAEPKITGIELEEDGAFARPSPDIFSGERLDRRNSQADDLIDDQFYEFFTHSVVVDRVAIDRRMKEEKRRKKKERGGWFARRRKKKELREEPEEPALLGQQPEEMPRDIFAGQEDFSVEIHKPERIGIEMPGEKGRTVELVRPAAEELTGRPAEKREPAPAEEKTAPAPSAPVEPAAQKVSAVSARPAAEEISPAPQQPAAGGTDLTQSVPEAKTPETGMPEAGMPEAKTPETGMPEAKMPEAGTPVGEPSAPAVEQTRQFDLPARSAEQAAGAMEESVPEKEQPASGGTPESEETTPFSIFGFGAKELPEDEQLPEDEEEVEEEEQEEEEEEPIEDYDSPSDAPTVQADLKSLKMTLGLRFVATAILGVLSLYLSLTASLTGLPRPAFLDPGSNPLAFLMTSGLMLLVAMLVNYNTIAAGLSSLWSDPSPDLLPTVAALAALIQCILLITDPPRFAASGYTLFSGVAVLCLAANTFGKCITARMVAENFEMASAGFDHAAAYQITDPELLKKVTDGLGETEPRLLVSRPTALVRGFLRQSFSEHRSDRLARLLGLAGLAGGLVCGVLAGLVTKDAFTAVSCFAGAVVLSAPLSSTLVGAIPAALMQSSAARVGAVVPGPSAVETLRSTNVVLVGARDLFPPSTVRLRGIKTFEKERIDLAILYAASILVEGCDTLRDIFLGVVEGKRDMLYPVENLVGEVGCGFMGWIENNRVIVGNREMMQRHDIEIPSMDYERRYTGEDKLPIYLAVSGKLFGMFLVSYGVDEEMAETVAELRRAGISLLVRSADFNVTSALVADRYGISPDSVKVLTGPELTALNPSLSYLPESEGVMTHIGSFASFIGGLRAASAAAGAEKAAAVVQTAAVVLGVLLGLLLSLTTGLGELSPLAVVLYHCAWLILTIAVPLMKRY
ncbi:MAG TPA: HAD family hydrolase [Candidatus Pygmaiobacter gallistercoris]|nr:HAD family hydrolase [Candidatus Pygmaiobacter gallistercoris]